MKIHKNRTAGAVLCLLLTLTGCGKQSQAPVITPIVPTNVTEAPAAQEVLGTTPQDVEALTLVVTSEDIHELEDYPNLQTLDLTGSDCYEAIERYKKFHEDIDITYTVSLGKTQADWKSTQLKLSEGDYSYDLLLENLKYIPNLTQLTLSNITLTAKQLEDLQLAYPDLELSYAVTILGQDYDTETTHLDLSAITPQEVETVVGLLPMLPNLQTVELMDDRGSSELSISQVKPLVDAAPDANFHYTFSLFGKTISTDDERVEYVGHSIGNEGEEQLRQALDIMTGCTYFKLQDCGIDNEVLAQLREDYPDTKIVWEIRFGKYTAMTDTDTIRAVYNVFDSTCHDLRYCNEVKYMDLGHNDKLTDFSFVGFMPDLEIMIASGSAVQDLSGFENCKKLQFLELASCNNLKDLTPLAGCESLLQLNISYTKVSSLVPLDGLPLERLMSIHTYVPAAEQTIFKEIHPDCWAVFYYGNQPFGKGWRYDDNGRTYSEMYKKVREVFDLDSIPQAWIDAENEAAANK